MFRLKISAFLLMACCATLTAGEGGLKPVGGPGAGEIVDGLQIALRPVKSDFGPGESILMQFTITNVSDKEIALNFSADKSRNPVFGESQIKLLRDGKELEVRRKDRDKKEEATYVKKALPPGAQAHLWIDILTISLAGDPFKTTGKYELSLGFEGGGKPVWSGKAAFKVVDAAVGHAQPEDPKLAERIKQLVEKLGADDFQGRESAQAELIKVGAPALAALEEALMKTDDAEVRLRCRKIIDSINGTGPVANRSPLCVECQNRHFTADIGKCADCGGNTPFGGWHLCRKCALKAGKCAACGKPLDSIVPPPDRIRPIERMPPQPLPPQPAPVPERPLPPPDEF